ncbi:unnamed protein product [Paramecium sonneborni]|uniref:Uncharacterized protein n=1 Tax=Paramecium sonneborni TaxID=65129 RepID=A0A8S1RS47_9CILI|nr:unnamed protein product [Paramecium sonneborni]
MIVKFHCHQSFQLYIVVYSVKRKKNKNRTTQQRIWIFKKKKPKISCSSRQNTEFCIKDTKNHYQQFTPKSNYLKKINF